MLNGDPQCQGETTWSRGEQKSSNDFIPCNQLMYKNFQNMYIDDEKAKFDLSDHHIIESFFFKLPYLKIRKARETETITYLKINETGSRSPCMRLRSDPPKMKNSTPDNCGGKKKNNNEANWMVSNSAKLDRRTKQHTQFGVSASNGSRDMARRKLWRKKRKEKEKK